MEWDIGFLQQRMAEAIPCRGLNPSEWMKWQPVSRPRRRAALVAVGEGQWKMVIRDMAAPAKRRRDMAPKRGRMSLVGWDATTVGCQARLTSRCSAA
ncbi:hypothetical protein GY15_17865 [Delftia sp. 670]|nr:hypothetical protein GY15_17865 [Delftia sp. 670]